MSEVDERKLQLDVHVSEYQTITNRSTYYMAISTVVWPAIGAYLTVVATFWGPIAERRYGVPTVVWVSVGVVQVGLLAWANMIYEVFVMVLYVERHLRPLVQKLTATPCFWLYEPFNTARRASGLYLSWEMSVPYAMLAALLITACFRVAPFLREHALLARLIDLGGVLVNSLLMWILFRTCKSIVATHREWERSERDNIEQCLSNSQASPAGAGRSPCAPQV